MVVNKTGTLVATKRHDYLPFGEEVYAGQGLRTSGLGYNADAMRQKFTAYERDSETGLDYARARYCSSSQGRFTSPDPLGASAKASDPQSWNRYAYVGNNPLAFSDPSGLIKTSSACPGCGGIQQGSHLGGTDEWFMGTDVGGETIETPTYSAATSSQASQQQQSGNPTTTTLDPQKPSEPQNEPGEIITCNIQVRLSEIDATKGTPFAGYHAYIVTSQSNETFKWYYRAGPENRSDYGNLVANSGEYRPGTVDYEPGTPRPNASVLQKGTCDKYRTSFADTERRTNESHIPYRPSTTNSNAYVYTALKRAGLPVSQIRQVLTPQLRGLDVFPGWRVELDLK
jgi:RHS repeat-associated protein